MFKLLLNLQAEVARQQRVLQMRTSLAKLQALNGARQEAQQEVDMKAAALNVSPSSEGKSPPCTLGWLQLCSACGTLGQHWALLSS